MKMQKRKGSTLKNNKNNVNDPLGENSRNPAKKQKSALKPDQMQ